MVIYNGDHPYAHSLTLSNLIEPEASRKIFHNLFTQPFSLIDLAAIPDETLREAAQDRVRGVALLMSFKHVFDRNLQEYLEKILLKLLRQLDQAGDIDEVTDVLYYLLNENGYLNKKRFWTVFHNEFSQEVESKMATIAEQIREETRLEIVKRLLADTSRSESDLIAWVHSMTGISMEKIRDLAKLYYGSTSFSK